MKRPSHFQRARRATNSREWHDAMGAAPDPNGVFARHGLTSWDKVHDAMLALTNRWEAMPEAVRQGYAFPNPEDRR